MRCEKCGSERTVSDPQVVVNECPLCHTPLAPEESEILNSAKGALRWIVENRGVEALLDAASVNALHADLAAADEAGRKRVRLALASGAGRAYLKL